MKVSAAARAVLPVALGALLLWMPSAVAQGRRPVSSLNPSTIGELRAQDATITRMLRARDLRMRASRADALVPGLRTLFGDAGFPIDAPAPSRWYLRLPEGTTLPAFAAPEEALRYAIDPAWMGEKPRAYRYTADGSRTAISGVLTAKELAGP